MAESRSRRPQTAREKEWENKPSCLWDPIEVSYCNNYEFPPKREKCETCLVRSVNDSLVDDQSSEALRWFIAYRRLMKKKETT